MIDRTPMLMAALAGVLALTACGDRGAAPGAPGGSRTASEEPIDAVPLPLDDNPLTPPPVVAVAAPVKAAAPVEEAATGEPVPATTPPAGAVETPLTPPRIVVAPRDPARTIERPVERPAERPADRPSGRPAERPTERPRPSERPASPDREPEKPVLTF